MGRHTFASCPRVPTISCPIPLQSPGRYWGGVQPPHPFSAHIPAHNACQLPTPVKPYTHGHDQSGHLLYHTALSKAQPAWITVLTMHTILPWISLPLPVAAFPEVPPLTLPAELPQQGSQATATHHRLPWKATHLPPFCLSAALPPTHR